MITLYGINNCTTVKAACRWLSEHQLDYVLHDFRLHGLEQEQLEAWPQKCDWQILLNRRSTTWRQLPAQDKSNINLSRAVQLMLAQPALIKRPVLTYADSVMVGFSEETYSQLL